MSTGLTRRLLVSGVLLAHAPYLGWLWGGAVGVPDVRSLGALAALLWILWQRRAELRTAQDARPFVWLASLLLALGGSFVSGLWLASLPLALLARTGLFWREALERWPLPLALAVAVFPFERTLGAAPDLALQNLTTGAAAKLLFLTGLSVQASHGLAPSLTSGETVVLVTALCAGGAVLYSVWTLGLVVGEIFVPTTRAKMAFALLAPLFAFGGNVLRIVASTHAACRWAADPLAWGIAHDAIGYGSLGATYLALYLLVRWLRAAAPVRASASAV